MMSSWKHPFLCVISMIHLNSFLELKQIDLSERFFFLNDSAFVITWWKILGLSLCCSFPQMIWKCFVNYTAFAHVLFLCRITEIIWKRSFLILSIPGNLQYIIRRMNKHLIIVLKMPTASCTYTYCWWTEIYSQLGAGLAMIVQTLCCPYSRMLLLYPPKETLLTPASLSTQVAAEAWFFKIEWVVTLACWECSSLALCLGQVRVHPTAWATTAGLFIVALDRRESCGCRQVSKEQVGGEIQYLTGYVSSIS